MPESAIDILWAFAILSGKHMVADFFLQTPYQYLNKGTYGHPGGILHSGIHAALTPLVYLILAPASLLLAILIPVGEFVVHYHVDWIKEQAGKKGHWSATHPWFWRALGVDQFAHNLTYIAIIAILLS